MNTRSFRGSFAVCVVGFLAVRSFQITHARAAMPPPVQASADEALPDAPGKAVVARLCTQCHGIEYVVPSERSVQVWRDTIDLMRGYGAEASDEDWKTITEYIIGNLAHLNVNKASAEEIGLVVAVNEKVAQGVVAYRDKEGGFKTIEDLKKAPDLDPQKIDALKPRLIFE